MSKEIINKKVFSNNESTLTMYTAEWCGPCNRIKPLIIPYIKELGLELIETIDISKSDFKLLGPDPNPDNIYKFIPFFVLSENENNHYIQTSNFDELKEVLEIIK